MEPERWEQIEQLYEAALRLEAGRRAAFLARACAGDEALRQEVATLLASDAQAGSFLAAPAAEVVARSVAAEVGPPPVGRQIGHYQVLSLLGAGGMGEVYLALDTRLGRKLALKLLPAQFTADADRLRRFEREARTASALNHPNIMTIHEIGEFEGTHYIVTEYVEGETLRERMTGAPRQRMKLPEALEIAVQVAAALSAAHEAGIVHRDIKPENVMVRRDGYVKVLDFGLAKLIEPSLLSLDSQASTAAKVGTGSGVVLGTPRYMSPEQARGQKVDARTDIFSLGVMLYEMIAGRAPFEGATPSDVIAAILTTEPPPLADNAPQAARELELLVGKALRKDREGRYQVVKDLLLDLKDLKQELESATRQARVPRSEAGNRAGGERGSGAESAESPVSRTKRRKRGVVAAPATLMVGAIAPADAGGRSPEIPSGEPLISRIKPHQRWALLACGTLIIAAAIPIYFSLRSRWQMPKMTSYTQVTSDGRLKRDAVVTDGSRIYFSELLGGQVVLAQVSSAGGETMPVHPPLPNANLLALSPDRSKLLVGRFEGSAPEGPLWVVPVTGGSPYRLGDVLGHAATWSPGGEWIAYAKGGELFLVKNDGSEPRKLMSVTGRIDWPRWSPDGSRLRFTVRDPKTRWPSLWEVAAEGADPRPLLPGWNKLEGECCGNWTADGKYFVFESSRDRASDIWVLREEAGLFARAKREPVRLTSGPMNFHAPVPSPDGRQIFVIGEQRRGELIRFDAKTRQFVSYLPGLSAEGLDFSADGEWITYTTYPEGDLWRSKVDGSQRLQLSFPPMQARMPRWSPDRKKIAFAAQLPGKPWKIYLVSAEGGSPQLLSPDGRDERNPDWSPDGNSLAFSSRTTPGALSIHLLDLRTNQVSMLPGGSMFSPRWSPDGRHIAALPLDSQKLMLFDLTSQEWVELARVNVGYPSWSRDGKYIYFTDQVGSADPGIKRLRIADRKVERLASLKELRLVQTYFGSWFGLAPDDSRLALRDVGIQDIYALGWQAP